ncbi:MAG: sigma 54-interacting transcriptional regulator [Candidatus Aminicenantes bacterium]|nr:sigma 54-interacting transcriptional regulator [Candidatus Aminicenantes bacterium]
MIRVVIVHKTSQGNSVNQCPCFVKENGNNFLVWEEIGARQGKFTGAVESKIGLIEAANQGTLFLDEKIKQPANDFTILIKRGEEVDRLIRNTLLSRLLTGKIKIRAGKVSK